MWVLRNVHNNEEKCFKMPVQGIVKVGRKDSDFCLGGNDHSISRHHAQLSIVTQDGEEFLQVEDMGSRYGTYVNNNVQPINCPKIATNNKMEPHSKVLLKSGDKVRFGLQWHIWFVYKYTYIVSSSKLDAAMSGELQRSLRELNVPYQTDWDATCTHLTMSGVVVTPKVACALASNKHIVTAQFWTEVLRVLSEGSGFYPKEEDYLPPILELAAKCEAVSFLPNPARSSLFAGLKFVALSQQQMRYFEQCITLAGGTISNIHRENFTKKELLDERTIVLTKTALHVESQQTVVNSLVDRLRTLFTKSQKRLVDESEIGFAIIFVSRESACNPYAPFTLPQLSQTGDSQQTSSALQDSEPVCSVSMIKTPRSGRKRDRSASPTSARKQSKRLTAASTQLTPPPDSAAQHSVDMMTFRDTERAVECESADTVGEVESATPRAQAQSEVYEMEANADEVDGDASSNARTRSRRFGREKQRGSAAVDKEAVDDRAKGKLLKEKLKRIDEEKDSSEDELENLFSKCQQLKSKASTRGRNKNTLVLSETDDNSSQMQRGSRGKFDKKSSEELCSTESTNFERGSEMDTSETGSSVFQKPTLRVSSRTKRSGARILSGESLDGWVSKGTSSDTQSKTTELSGEHADIASCGDKQSNASEQSLDKTSSTLKSRARLVNASRLDSSDEEDIFEQSTLSRRGNSTLTNTSLAGTSSTKLNNTRGNVSVANTFTSRTDSLWKRDQDDDDEDNVFGTPACKPLSEISRLGKRTWEDSAATPGDESDGTSLGNSNRFTTGGSAKAASVSRKRAIEEESGNMLRTAEMESLQDRGLLRDEPDHVAIDTNCCVISIPFQLKKYTLSSCLENKKLFKKQSLPGRDSKSHRAPITFYPVFASVLDDVVKSEPCTAE